MNRLSEILKAKELKPLYNMVFIICCVLFLSHQLTQRVLFIPLPAADHYLDNLLATPILLTLLLVERRTLFRYPPNYTLSSTEVCLASLVIAAAGELFFPALSKEFTSDWLDVIFYSIGSVVFYFFINNAE